MFAAIKMLMDFTCNFLSFYQTIWIYISIHFKWNLKLYWIISFSFFHFKSFLLATMFELRICIILRRWLKLELKKKGKKRRKKFACREKQKKSNKALVFQSAAKLIDNFSFFIAAFALICGTQERKLWLLIIHSKYPSCHHFA